MKVAVAIIPDKDHRILVTQRPKHAMHGGCWEFPGGKLEENESPEQALIREVKEEVGLDVMKSTFLGEISYRYPTHFVTLYIFYVDRYLGTPAPMESQLNMKWVSKNELDPKDFPEANHKIFQLIPDFENIIL